MKVTIKILLLIFLLGFNSLFSQSTEQILQKGSDTRLLQPITVTIGGNFVVTGSFTAFATQRLDHFITQLFNETMERSLGNISQFEVLKKMNDEFAKYPLRDIVLKRMNGQIIKIDLFKYRLSGDFSQNPYLMNDDVIIFPGNDENTNFIDITGAVNKPLKFQFVEGDKLSDAIIFAGGINPAYNSVTVAEISRLHEKGNREELITVSINEDFSLNRGDRIRILFDENSRKDYKVLVIGEVNSPGYIHITRDNTTIKDVIRKAKGFTSGAWLERSELLRGTNETEILKMNSLRESFEKDKNFNMLFTEKLLNEVNLEQLKLFRMADTFPEDSMVVIIDNALRVLQSKSIIDFTKINSDTSADGSYKVSDGDIIVVPRKEEMVYVFGQVNNPGFVRYENGKKYSHYLNKAGGLGERAEDEIKLIKGDSYAWITADEYSVVDAGDFIYVPKNVPVSFDYYLRAIGSISSVVTAIATVILILLQSSK